MGQEQSNSSRKNTREVNQNDVERLLQQQKELYEQKYAELLRVAKAQKANTEAAMKTAREEARKEVEKIMKEKREHQLRQNAQLNNVPPQPSAPQTSSTIENRASKPYSCSGSALTSPILHPFAQDAKAPIPPTSGANVAKPSPNIYPNISRLSGNTANVNQPTMCNASPSSNGPTSELRTHTFSYGRPSEANVAASMQNMKIGPIGNDASLNNNNFTTRTAVEPSTSQNDAEFVFLNHPQRQSTAPSAPRLPATRPRAPRDRSISKTRTFWTRNNDNEEDLFNCPTCKNLYIGNIYQCVRGHSSCSSCKFNNMPCGSTVSKTEMCRLPISATRNYDMERYLSDKKTNCPNSIDGCKLVLKLTEIKEHLKECPFGEMVCPLFLIFGQCQWKGKLPQLAGHFDNVHQMHRQANVDAEMVMLDTKQDSHIVYLIDLGRFNFLFHAKVSQEDGMIYMTVQLVGTQHSAAKWTYEVHIYNKRQPRRKYQYMDKCNSLNTPLSVLIQKSECANIPLVYAKTLLNEGCLTYKFYIKKDNEIDDSQVVYNQQRPRRRYGKTKPRDE